MKLIGDGSAQDARVSLHLLELEQQALIFRLDQCQLFIGYLELLSELEALHNAVLTPDRHNHHTEQDDGGRDREEQQALELGGRQGGYRGIAPTLTA